MATHVNISVPNTDLDMYLKWARGIAEGIIPADSRSARMVELMRQDLERNAHKFRKAGVSTAAKKGGAK